MDDGGIELNFAAPSSSAGIVKRQITSKKGGRWTDRVKAKKNARNIVKKLGGDEAPASVPITAVQRAAALVQRAAAPVSRAAAPVQRAVPAAPRTVPQADPVARPTPQMVATSAVRFNPTIATKRDPPSTSYARPQASSLYQQTKPKAQAPETAVAGPSRLPLPSQGMSAPAKGPKPAPQIISSLFTSNPLHTLPAGTPSTSTPGLPSNAPLGDTSTFQGLGLDPLLIRHLKNKMGVDNPTGIQRSSLPFMIAEPLDINQPVHQDDDDDDDYEAQTMSRHVEAPLRDVFIQSQTGSGKTLAYLLPIIQTLLPLSRLSYIDRSIGTLAIILVPTRELAQQISKVLESILSMALSLPGEEEDRGLTRWLVSGLLTGGSTRTHEKARLRKGVPILVSTPGRLLDHLQNTESFKCAKTLYLVLDEADRLMELGFEETILGIVKALDGRRRIEMAVEKEMDAEGGGLMRWPYWSRGRRTVLCSATVDGKVEKLAGAALRDPVLFRGTDEVKQQEAKEAKEEKERKENMTKEQAVEAALKDAQAITIPKESEDKFTPPSQLSQKYIVAPTKLRLVTLVALLRSLVSPPKAPALDLKGMKVIVFLSSTDSVDFHWKLLGGVSMGGDEPSVEEGGEGESADEDGEGKEKKPVKPKKTTEELIALTSALFPNTSLHRLHGSLPLRTRLSSLSSFATPSPTPSILFATSVASRGLDLPLVRAVVQYDLPTEGGANEYVHRVGRTARAGKGGEAWAFVGPSEAAWVPWVEIKMGGAEGTAVGMSQVGVEDVLRRGFGGKTHEFEGRATEVQLNFEKWVLENNQNATLARNAFSSFVRAYSTHPLEEKRFFHIKQIHLGHLAKSFALREAPGALSSKSSKPKDKAERPLAGKRKRDAEDDDEEEERKGGKEGTARNETERRMYEAVRKTGRLVRSGGKMGEFQGGNGRKGNTSSGGGGGGGEFQVVGTSDLERMVKFGK